MKAVGNDVLSGLPGEHDIRQGLVDWQAGRSTVASCLVAISSPRLKQAGLLPEPAPSGLDEPERELYRSLRAEGGDAYSRYNALIRELISFGQALDRRLRQEKATELKQKPKH